MPGIRKCLNSSTRSLCVVSGLVFQKFGDLFRSGELAFEFSRQAIDGAIGGDADWFADGKDFCDYGGYF